MTSDKPIYKPELAAKSKQAKRLDLTIKTMTKKLKALTDEIKNEMGTQDFVFDGDGVILVEWTRYEKLSFQEKVFKEEHPDLALQYSVMKEERRFYLK